jgi:glycosyltransferase involved in cell wall biosynthesis
MSLIAAVDARLIGAQSTGDSSYWAGLIRGFSQIETDARILLLSNTDRPKNIPDAPQFEWIRVDSPTSRLWSLLSFPQAAKKLGAHVVHSQYSLSPLVKRGGVTTIHDVSFFIGPEWFQLKDRLILQNSVPATAKRAAAVITVSETSKAEIEQYIPAARGKTHVTYNALGSNIKEMTDEEAAAIVRDELEVTDPYVLTVGTRWPRKNMQLAAQAVDKLPDAAPQKLVVTGKFGWGDEMLGDRSIPVGYVSDRQLTALYRCADLYLAPSRHEGFGIPLLEAWACDCPVLSSRGGSLPEVAGHAAELEPTYEVDSWSDSIATLLESQERRDELIKKGRVRLGDFSWKETARKTLDIYKEAADA